MPDENQTATGEPDAATVLAVELLAAYVSNNSVPPAELPELIALVRAAVAASGTAAAAEAAAAPTPAVSVKKSIAPDYLVCLDDGKKFKSLRRHLATLGLTPDEYRAKWGLPADYPMVAPNYSAARSALAKSIGLGQVRQGAAAEPAGEAQAEPEAKAPTAAKKASRARKNGKAQVAASDADAATGKKPRTRKAVSETAAA